MTVQCANVYKSDRQRGHPAQTVTQRLEVRASGIIRVFSYAMLKGLDVILKALRSH